MKNLQNATATHCVIHFGGQTKSLWFWGKLQQNWLYCILHCLSESPENPACYLCILLVVKDFHCFPVALCKWRPLTLKPLPSEQHSRSDIWPLNSTTDSLVFADQRVASAPSMSRQLVSWAVDHREWSWKEKPGNGDVWPVCVEDPGHLLQGLHLVRGEQVSEGCQQGGVHQIGHCLPLKSKHLSCRCYYIVRTGSTGCSVKVLGQPSLANLVSQWKGSHP